MKYIILIFSYLSWGQPQIDPLRPFQVTPAKTQYVEKDLPSKPNDNQKRQCLEYVIEGLVIEQKSIPRKKKPSLYYGSDVYKKDGQLDIVAPRGKSIDTEI